MVLVTETPKSKEFITWLTTHTRDAERRKNDVFLDRFLNSPKVQSITSGTWVDRRVVCKHDTLAQEDRSYTNTAREHRRLASTWTVHQNSSGKTDQCQRDLVLQKLCESEIVCVKSQVKRMGEFIPVSKDDNEVTTHFWRQVKEVYVLIARRDGSGIRILLHGRLLNFGGHRPAGTNSLIIKERLQDFASRKWRFPVTDGECAQYTSHVTFSRTLSCVAHVLHGTRDSRLKSPLCAS